MPTMPILAQPVPCASIAASIFSVTAITSEQHRKAALGTGERISNKSWELYLNDYWSILELHNFSGKLTETALSTRLASIQRQVEETSSKNEQKLKHVEAIQAKRISLEDRKAELMKELEQVEVEMQGVDAEILKLNDEMSCDQHLMAYLKTEHTNLKNTPVVSSKDSEDLEALHIVLEEKRAEVAQLKWMD
ncbi:hypothetical protein ACH5RR_003347 [Cinchona calisaya]|uniref:Uncharacterized protein n=1 Tax=Cinchona calisaya TaxID=153742 RepID=A0ABD3AUK7_9GENT